MTAEHSQKGQITESRHKGFIQGFLSGMSNETSPNKACKLDHQIKLIRAINSGSETLQLTKFANFIMFDYQAENLMLQPCFF